MLLSTERFLSRKDKGKGIAADTEILIVSRITKDLETIPSFTRSFIRLLLTAGIPQRQGIPPVYLMPLCLCGILSAGH